MTHDFNNPPGLEMWHMAGIVARVKMFSPEARIEIWNEPNQDNYQLPVPYSRFLSPIPNIRFELHEEPPKDYPGIALFLFFATCASWAIGSYIAKKQRLNE